jgi:hypothetical protein
MGFADKISIYTLACEIAQNKKIFFVLFQVDVVSASFFFPAGILRFQSDTPTADHSGVINIFKYSISQGI